MRKAAKKGHNSGIAGEQLISIIERVENLLEEKSGIANDIKDIFAEAQGNGFDPKTIRMCIKLRAMDAAAREEQEHLLETYKRAIGLAMLD